MQQVNWLGEEKLSSYGEAGRALHVKYRSIMSPIKATVKANNIGDVIVIFDDEQFGVSPGQACVFYDGERVLGGGWISNL